MTYDATIASLAAIARPMATSMGLVLWGIEYLSGPAHSVLRIYIEAEGRGVDVEDCATLSRNLDVALDVEDVIPGRYVLEVSSPGFDRRFFEPAQMNAYVGRDVEIALRSARLEFPGRKNFRGVLKTIDGLNIILDIDGCPVSLSWPEIKKARLVDYGGLV